MWGCLGSIVLIVAPALYAFGGRPWWYVAIGAALVAFFSLFMKWSDTEKAIVRPNMSKPVALTGLYLVTFAMVALVMAIIAALFSLVAHLL